MKRNFYRFPEMFKVVFVMVLSLLILNVSPINAIAKSENKKISWRMQTVDPPSLMGPKTTVKGFIERVEAMSGGQLGIKLFTAGQLVPTMEITDALEQGTIQIAYTSGVYYTGSIPEGALELTSLPPMLLPTIEDAIQVYWYEGVDDIMREAYAERGIYYLGSIFLGDPITNWSKKPINKIADYNGYKVRSFGYISKVLAEVGASPTLIPHEEVYSSLAQGVIDGSLTAGSYYERLKYFEVCSNYYLPGLIAIPSMSIMVSLDAWNKLPDNLKAILKEAQKTLAYDHYIRLHVAHERMLNNFDKLGTTLIRRTDAETEKLREVSISMLEEVAKKSPKCKKGVQIIKNYMQKKGYLE